MWSPQNHPERWLRRWKIHCATAHRKRGFGPRLERLEDRTVLSSFTAANVADLINGINAANLAGGSNTITLQAGTTFTLTAVDNTTDGPTGLPVIAANDNLTIVGSNDAIERSTANRTPAFRLLDVAAGATLTLQNLTLQGGLATAGPNPVYGVIASGGAVNNLGAATLTGVTIQNNTAQGPDGSPGGDGVTAMGGGVFSGGSLTVDGCTIQNNQAIGGKGGKGYLFKDSRDRFGNEHIPPGNGGNGFGGGVFVGGGTASLHNCTVSGNTAQGSPAGGGNATDGLGEGGGFYIDPTASVCLDAFTQANVTTNSASTTGNNIYGTFTTC